jgi:hypothetical protein
MTHGWLPHRGDPPHLIPVSISTQAQYNGKIHWCRSGFINYQVFSSRVKMMSIARSAID